MVKKQYCTTLITASSCKAKPSRSKPSAPLGCSGWQNRPIRQIQTSGRPFVIRNQRKYIPRKWAGNPHGPTSPHRYTEAELHRKRRRPSGRSAARRLKTSDTSCCSVPSPLSLPPSHHSRRHPPWPAAAAAAGGGGGGGGSPNPSLRLGRPSELLSSRPSAPSWSPLRANSHG